MPLVLGCCESSMAAAKIRIILVYKVVLVLTTIEAIMSHPSRCWTVAITSMLVPPDAHDT